jgi:hypothetical protein
VPHYYGDFVRQLFLVGAIGMLVLIPFFEVIIPLLLPFQVFGALLLIVLAAMTNPRNKTVMISDAIAAIVGAAVFELVAMSAYTSGLFYSFLAHQVLAAVFMFALYFALKTVRAMETGRIGKRPTEDEFRRATWEELSYRTRDPRNN